MRMFSLVFSFVVTVSLAAAALTYLGGRIGQQRIYVQDQWVSTSDQRAYHSYGEQENVSDSARTDLGDSLPSGLTQ